MKSLFTRYTGNPILSAENWPYPINSVFNPGATLLPDGRTLLLCRCEDYNGCSHFTTAISHNGSTDWIINSEPSFVGQDEEEKYGVEDPRIVWHEELNAFSVVYTSVGEIGPGVSIALTQDFISYERLGQVMFAENKDAYLLPRRFNQEWVMIHRPVTARGNASIWMSFSRDMIHWGDHQILMQGRGGCYWDSSKIGGSCPLIETDKGWLMIYHSNRHTPAGCLYRCGLALLDLEDPTYLICRGDGWIFGPEEYYEQCGDVGNVVFSCGTTEQHGTLCMYYGAADSSICLASAEVSQLLDWVCRNGV